jgi:hypothetical protein
VAGITAGVAIFPCRYPRSPSQNPPPPALLRPRRPLQCLPGEALVLLDPSPSLFPRRLAVHGRPSPVSGSRSGWASAPADLASVAARVEAGAPQSVTVGHSEPVQEVSMRFILIPENLLQMFETCRIHRILSVRQKNTNDLSKCLEKCNLQVYVKFMHC